MGDNVEVSRLINASPEHVHELVDLPACDERIQALLIVTLPDLLECFGVGPDTGYGLGA